MLKTISRTTPATLIENSSESFANEESHQLLRHSIIPTNVKELEIDFPLSPYFYFPSRASLRIFSILVVIKSIATVLVTPSGMITSA